MKFETLEELIEQRRGYKFLDKDGVSPYQKMAYDIHSKKIFRCDGLDTNVGHDCGSGYNLATLKWIADNCLKLDGIILECSIPKSASVIIPKKSDGKFRVSAFKITRIYSVSDFFPMLKNFQERLSAYTPANPITAEKMPDKNKIKKIMAQVRAQVWDQVWAQMRDQVWDQMRDQVWAQVGDQVRAQVWAQVGAQVRDQMRAQMRDQVWDQVGAQVRNQVRVCVYKAVVDFLGLPYDHPAFDLIRLGIMVVKVYKKFNVFGKGGKFLGEFDEAEGGDDHV